ncbi:MAG TPA: hypothetical protein VFQ90_04750, partial [Stellaceae bacterium]|nr:hypothetical protein [Stellaceae bacterium]
PPGAGGSVEPEASKHRPTEELQRQCLESEVHNIRSSSSAFVMPAKTGIQAGLDPGFAGVTKG